MADDGDDVEEVAANEVGAVQCALDPDLKMKSTPGLQILIL